MVNGLCVSAGDLPSKWASNFKSLGVTGVRIWSPSLSSDYNDATWFAKNTRPWVDAGFSVTACITFKEATSDVPTPAQAAGIYAKFAKATAGNVTSVELFNEPNLVNYNPNANATNWAALLVEYLRVARQAFGSQHITGPAVTYADSTPIVLAKAKALVDAGCLQYVDAMGLHPYSRTGADLVAKVQGVKALIGSKPLVCTESNVHTSDATLWAKDLAPALAAIRPLLSRHYYYRSYPASNGSTLGPYAPFRADGTHAGAFATVQAAMMPPTNTTNTTPGGSYLLQGVLYHDANSNGKFDDGGSNVVVGATVKLVREGVVVAERVTDKNGWYGFTNTAAGNYQVVATTSTSVQVAADTRVDIVVK